MDAYARAVPPPETVRWPAAGRAAALFVGVPLTAALLLAAAPLSEPPPGPSALPVAVSAPGPPRIQAPVLSRDCDQPTRAGAAPRTSATPRARRVVAAPPPVVAAPPAVPPARVVTAADVAAPARFVPTARAAALAPASIVTIGPGVERVALQSP